MTSWWHREESEALLEHVAEEDTHEPLPAAAEGTSPPTPTDTGRKSTSAKSQSPGKRKSSAVSEPAAAVAATSRDPRPLTAMQELL